MSSSTDLETKQVASGETKQEAPLVEQSISGDAKPDPSVEQPTSNDPDPSSQQEEPKSAEKPQDAPHEPVVEKGKSTITELASSAASTATNAALGVKDNMFSMFGGGSKKEKKEPADDPEEASGSAKAQKEAEADAEAPATGEVSVYYLMLHHHVAF
jgi:Ran-binding protein 1